MPSPLRTRAEQNELLLEIERHARDLARVARRQDLDDVVGDVVLYCLEKLRSKRWPRPDSLRAYVSQLVMARVVNGLRAEQVAEENVPDIQLVGQTTGSPALPVDCEWDEERINAFRDEVMTTLRGRVREAYRLVRVQEMPYEVAAAQMHVTVGTLHQYVARAHRAFRAELERLGVSVRPADLDGRRRRGWRRRGKTRFAPVFVSKVPASVSS